MTKTFFAIYDANNKMFKGRSTNRTDGWTDIPTQTYNTEGRATGALKSSKKIDDQCKWAGKPEKMLMVIPVTVSWADPTEILEGMFK